MFKYLLRLRLHSAVPSYKVPTPGFQHASKNLSGVVKELALKVVADWSSEFATCGSIGKPNTNNQDVGWHRNLSRKIRLMQIKVSKDGTLGVINIGTYSKKFKKFIISKFARFFDTSLSRHDPTTLLLFPGPITAFTNRW